MNETWLASKLAARTGMKWFALGSLALLTGACGSSPGSGTSVDGGGVDATAHDTGTKETGGHHPETGHLTTEAGGDAGTDGACVSGRVCGDGGVCAGGSCCPSARACATECCGAGLLCSFGKCVTPGASCFDSTDCDGGAYCQYAVAAGQADAGVTGDASSCVGGALPQGVCLPAPPTCPGDASAPDGASCIESCSYRPEAGTFAPVLKYTWGGLDPDAGNPSDIMMAPIAVPMKDTNCDGKINAEDIPDLVFTTFLRGNYHTDGTLHAIHVQSDAFVDDWSVAGPIMVSGAPYTIEPGFLLAGGDLDGAPGAEVVACLIQKTDAATTYAAAAFHPDGSLYWSTPVGYCYMPSIADLDQDGHPEVITEGGILNGQTGAVTPFTNAAGTQVSDIGIFVVSDLDGDGFLDVITGGQAYHADGKIFVDTPTWNGFPAIGDFDHDGKPEVVSISDGRTAIWHYVATDAGPNYAYLKRELDSTAIAGNDDAGACASTGGGPPTIADFNGDGVPDIAFAGSITYTVYDGAKVANLDAGGADAALPGDDFYLWRYFPTDDCSSAETGSTIFDFTGSGVPEVLYSDQQKLRVFGGPDGGILWQTCNTTGTLWEYPIVLDVDNDGHADIVVVSNGYAIADSTVACQDYDGGPHGESGLRVFSDPNFAWVRTRALWNEHPYHITNVNDDGTIPANELPNWKQPGLNNFRQNKAPGYEFAAGDAIVSLNPSCGSPLVLTATVRNIGEAALPAGVLVEFYAGSPGSGTKVGSATTTLPLYSAQSQTLTLSSVPSGQGSSYYAVVDPPDAPPHPAWHECNTSNNTSAPITIAAVCGTGPK